MSFLRDRLRVETEKVPTTLWAFVAIMIVWGVIAAGGQAAHPHPFLPPLLSLLLSLLFTFGFAVLILRRNQVLWTLSVIASALTLVALPLGRARWWLFVLALLDLCLLLSPPTWRFIWSDRPDTGAAWQITGDRVASTGSGRADGWYVDPEDPKRMRYWSSTAGKWLGDTRTPRELRESWRAGGGA